MAMPSPGGATLMKVFNEQVITDLQDAVNTFIAATVNCLPIILTYSGGMTATGHALHTAVLEYEISAAATTKQVLTIRTEDVAELLAFLTSSNTPPSGSIVSS